MEKPRQVCKSCGGTAFEAVFKSVQSCWTVGPELPEPPDVAVLRCKACRKVSWAPPWAPPKTRGQIAPQRTIG